MWQEKNTKKKIVYNPHLQENANMESSIGSTVLVTDHQNYQVSSNVFNFFGDRINQQIYKLQILLGNTLFQKLHCKVKINNLPL